MNSSKAMIFTLGNRQYGLGHKVRSSALREAFLPKWDVSVIDISSSDILNLNLDDVAFFILDLPAEHDRIYDVIRMAPGKKIALDYFGVLPFDLVISVFEHFGKLEGLRKSGLEYVIIRDEVKKTSPAKGDYVLVSLGGADVLKKSAHFATEVAQRNLQGKLIIGQAAEVPANVPENIEVLRAPQNFAEIMARSSWGITNGGGTMLEMVYLHKPSYVFPQSQFEQNLARELLRQNLVLGIYPEEIRPDQELDFSNCPVDGNGSSRIRSEIEAIL